MDVKAWHIGTGFAVLAVATLAFHYGQDEDSKPAKDGDKSDKAPGSSGKHPVAASAKVDASQSQPAATATSKAKHTKTSKAGGGKPKDSDPTLAPVPASDGAPPVPTTPSVTPSPDPVDDRKGSTPETVYLSQTETDAPKEEPGIFDKLSSLVSGDDGDKTTTDNAS